ncbi:MAG: hypothetical protein HC799_13080 [Limnothrix sp. RL_2_0]|nr:hypothetical protein [Limnothrix sp. RL_2_0]
MDIPSKIAIIITTLLTIGFASTVNAAEVAALRVDGASQGFVDLQQWDPAPEDSGQCNGKKCATGGSY